jgi:iron(III) transport system ATP-binding protein
MSRVIVVEGARKLYGVRAAVDGVDLTLEPGRITCLLGPSGCGKSTLLRLIAGLEPLDGGHIRIGGTLMSGGETHMPPERREIGFVFQDFALFPHLTVAENVAFGLRHMPREERDRRVVRRLEAARLADRASLYPHNLSGGEQQRIALARALARDPAAILLDEPFSGLDAHLKAQVRDELLAALMAAGAAAAPQKGCPKCGSPEVKDAGGLDRICIQCQSTWTKPSQE